MRFYENKSSDPRENAQRNLMGRTHYADPDTLRWHKARILSARPVDGGLLFAIVESVALDMQNSKRGCRYVIFDIFGNVVGKRRELSDCFSRSGTAEKFMWKELNAMDARAITLDAITRAEKQYADEMESLRVAISGDS